MFKVCLRVDKPVFRYKKFQKNKDFRFCKQNLIFQGKPRKVSPVSKDKLYFIQKTGTLNNLPLQESYKFFNLKTSSLINLIFISLNQSTNFSHNYRSNKNDVFVGQINLKQNLNKLSVCPTLSRFVSPSTSYLSLKKSVIHSLRSTYKINGQPNLVTNLHKLIRIQDYTNKLYLLITSETKILFEKKQSETSKSKKILEDNLKNPLQTQLSKFLTRKKVVKTNIQLKQEKINKVFSYFNLFTHKTFVDYVDYVENSKKRLLWGPLSDRKLLFAKDSKKEKFIASIPSNTVFSGAKPSSFFSKEGVKTYNFVWPSSYKAVGGVWPYTADRTSSDVRNQKIKPIQYSLQNYQRSNQDTCLAQRPSVLEGEWVQKGDLLADCTASVSGDLSLGKNILVAYMPWEGYNFEDAILISEKLVYDDIYTSLHIERYEIEIRDTKFGVEQISNKIPEVNISEILHLDERGIARIGSWVKEGNILIGKVTPIQKKSLSPHEKLLYDIVGKKIPTTRDTSLRVPKGVEGKVINVEILETENIPPGITFEGPGRVHIYLAEKRKIQVGDKISGRHGNKGIVSKIIPRQDMPYLPNGTPIDMVLNPLGVPSRMNVGQVFEALLGLAGLYLNQSFKIPSFDETYGPEASRSIIYSKLYEARLKTGQKWLFDPNFPGKTRVFDGRTGQCFDQLVTVGQTYMLKLVHLVDDKIHARSTGPYSLVTQQPLGGRSKHGGQRLGEMEVWALEGFGAAYTLQELLTIKSDDIQGRHQVINAILTEAPITLGTPESFKVLIRELQSLCLDLDIYTIGSMGRATPMDVMKLP